MKRLSIFYLAALLCLCTPAFAHEGHISTERVGFAAGSNVATIENSLSGYEIIDYQLAAEAGQVLLVNMTTDSGANYFNLHSPGEADLAFFNGSVNGNAYVGNLTDSGTYTVRVYQMRSAARRNETASFTLRIELASADYADGLSGGPDFWEIHTQTLAGTVNLRAAPSTISRVLDRYPAGTVLRNQGCRLSEGRRWCLVEKPEDHSAKGWIAGDFLRESGYLEPQQQIDALVPGTGFHATGQIPCARRAGQPMTSCRFGVVRQGHGTGYIKIFWPDLGNRVILFEEGIPVDFNKSDADGDKRITVERDADLFMIRIGDQRFEIPQAVIDGG